MGFTWQASTVGHGAKDAVVNRECTEGAEGRPDVIGAGSSGAEVAVIDAVLHILNEGRRGHRVDPAAERTSLQRASSDKVGGLAKDPAQVQSIDGLEERDQARK